MKTSLDMVKEFHEAFGHPVADKPNLKEVDLKLLRLRLLQEELDELEEALAAESPASTLDALLDLQYVLDGAFLALGFHRVKDLAFRDVHDSNMSKLGEDGKPVYREDGKIMKGPNYEPVNLEPWIKFLSREVAGHRVFYVKSYPEAVQKAIELKITKREEWFFMNYRQIPTYMLPVPGMTYFVHEDIPKSLLIAGGFI